MAFFNLRPLEDFEYPPLDSSQRVFRVVRLLPPKPARLPGAHGTLRIEILQVDVDSEHVSYDALSHAWNYPSFDRGLENRRVLVETADGPRGLRIQRSLELALLHLVAKEETRRPLFIDQISINQKNREEKSHQIPLMRDIYANCIRTVVWLGPATRGSDALFGFIQEICAEGVVGGLLGPRVGSVMRVYDAVTDPAIELSDTEREDRDGLVDMVHRLGHRFPIDGLADVLDRRWFNRLWIVQEACLAPGLMLVCGRRSLCFDCFRCGLFFYSVNNALWIRGRRSRWAREITQRSDLYDKINSARRIFQERKAIHRDGIKQSLYDVVLKYNVNQRLQKIGATEPEDRIYGLLGLVASEDDLLRRLRIRYVDVAQTYTEVAALLLQDNIDALLFCQFPKGGAHNATLPSWVPDWAMDLDVPVGYTTLKKPVFSAGGPKHEARVRIDEVSRQLTIRGVLVDRIARVGTRTLRPDPKPMASEQIDYRWFKLFFDEVTEICGEAAVASSAHGLPIPDTQTPAQIALRLQDSGLSARHFQASLGARPGLERLEALSSELCRVGERLLLSDERVASYRITRIYRTIGITPWYWEITSDMHRLRTCARGPEVMGKILYEALADFIVDVAACCVASLLVSTLTPLYLRLKRRFSRMENPKPEALKKIGSDPDVVLGQDMSDFTGNLLKNRGRKLYRTEKGYVGVGPAQTKARDSVVVFHGGTVPHILRHTDGTGDVSSWQYLGEAYGDGIMDGEALAPGFGVETSFVIG